MFRKYSARIALLGCLASPLAQAANIDLSTFTLVGSPSSGSTVALNSAYIEPDSLIFSNAVSNVSSFEWRYSVYGQEYSEAYFEATALGLGNTLLSTSAALANFGTTFWKTYSFATAYSGPLVFGLAGHEDSAAVLELRNLSNAPIIPNPSAPVIPAVPEPESYAMLVAGLGLMAGITRRRHANNAARTAMHATAVLA